MKAINSILPAPPGHWVGDGFPVRSIFGQHSFTNRISPFLMMDYAGPAEFEPTSARRGVGEHPHKGFETVTIVYQGGVEHGDSVGNRGVIGPGDVQWMTAARGIVHEEFHSRGFAETGGPFEMIQLWVNLPKKDKSAAPNYQTLLNDQIPTVELAQGSGSLRVIAGSYGDATGPASTFTPVDLWDLKLSSGAESELTVTAGHNTLLFVLSGELQVNANQTLSEAQVAIFEPDGTSVSIHARADTTALLLSGEPIDEPIAARGPFVMNSPEELQQAVREFYSGQMGRISR